jgi:putative ABC transport system permease protein
MLKAIWRDFVYSARLLRRTPGFTVATALILALAIGANTAIFSVVETVLLRGLPYRDPEQLVVLGERSQYAEFGATTPGNFLDYQRQLRSFESVAAATNRIMTLTGRGMPVRLNGQVVSSNFFDLWGVPSHLGRTLKPGLDRAHGPRAAVLSYGAWQQNFDGDPGVIGRPVTLNGESFTVVGVMPESFVTPRPAEIWVSPRYEAPEPLSDSQPDVMQDRGNFNFLRPFARLRPGVSLSQAQAELTTFSRQLEQQYPGPNANKVALATSLHEWTVGNVRVALLTLQTAVGLILLIACANVANLLLARGTLRQREMAVRSSLGAGRLQLLRQMLSESLLLALLGGALGLLFATWGVRVLALKQPGDLPRLNELQVNPKMLLFALVASLLTALMAGIVPAWRTSRADLTEALKQGGRSTTAGGHRLRKALVVLEVTLSVALLVTLSLLVRSFSNLLDVHPGFDPNQVLVAEFSLPTAVYNTDEKARSFFGEFLERARALPGVTMAGLVDTLPLGNNGLKGQLLIGDRPLPEAGEQLTTEKRVVSPGYFETMRIPLLKGRRFQESDNERSMPVVIINQRLAEVIWPNQDPLGKTIGWGGPWMTVIGVVGNVHQHNLEESDLLDSYAPYRQAGAVRAMAIAVRSNGDPAALGSSLRRAAMDIDKDQPLTNVALMQDLVSRSYARRRFQTALIASLGLLALILAAVGVYGIMSYTVSQRTHEFGIRLALGAEQARLFRSVLGESVSLAGMGVLAGIVTALALVRFMSSLLYEVTSTDLVSYGLPSLIVLTAALLAGYLPARRVMAIDPLVAMRDE